MTRFEYLNDLFRQQLERTAAANGQTLEEFCAERQPDPDHQASFTFDGRRLPTAEDNAMELRHDDKG